MSCQFLSHDGISTFTELVDAQQNAFNFDYSFSVILAALGIGLTGDPITEKMSIGCDATSRTSSVGSLLGREGGLNAHNVSFCGFLFYSSMTQLPHAETRM